jgi:hypothetical protein
MLQFFFRCLGTLGRFFQGHRSLLLENLALRLQLAVLKRLSLPRIRSVTKAPAGCQGATPSLFGRPATCVGVASDIGVAGMECYAG